MLHAGLALMGVSLLAAGALALFAARGGPINDWPVGGASAALVCLLVLGALPGRSALRLGGGFGVVPQQEGRAAVWTLDVGPGGTEDRSAGAAVRVPVEVRVPVPGAGPVLAGAALLAVLAGLGYLLLHAGIAAAPRLAVMAPHALGASGGLLLALAAFLCLRPLFGPSPPLDPEVAAAFATRLQLDAGRELLAWSAPKGPWTASAAGAWLDVLLLLLAAGLAVRTAYLHLQPAPEPRRARAWAGWSLVHWSLPLQAVSLLVGSWLASRAWGAAWQSDPTQLAAAGALGLTALALALRRGLPRGRPWLPELVAAVALLAAGWALFGAAGLHDVLAAGGG